MYFSLSLVFRVPSHIKGVGQKVADCVALFSLDALDAVPVDTHMLQLAVRNYGYKSQTKSLTTKVSAAVGMRSLWWACGLYDGRAVSVVGMCFFSCDKRAAKFEVLVITRLRGQADTHT